MVLGAFASGYITDMSTSARVLLLVMSWILLSGSVYIINDISDYKNDKNHPRKSLRPIAANLISKKAAAIFLIPCLTLSFGIQYTLGFELSLIGATYFLINVSYSLYFKNLVVIDLLLVSSGFVLRGLSGVYVVDATPSVWFVLLSLFGSLLLVGGKRSAQKVENESHTQSNRALVSFYSANFLNQIQTICSTGLIICYVMMTQEKNLGSNFEEIMLNLSIIPFLSTILYINYYHDSENEADVASMLFKKKPLAISATIWACFFYLSLAA